MPRFHGKKRNNRQSDPSNQIQVTYPFSNNNPNGGTNRHPGGKQNFTNRRNIRHQPYNNGKGRQDSQGRLNGLFQNHDNLQGNNISHRYDGLNNRKNSNGSFSYSNNFNGNGKKHGFRRSSDQQKGPKKVHEIGYLVGEGQQHFQQPTPDPPKFGYERDWHQDDFLVKFVMAAYNLHAFDNRLLSYSGEEQRGVLKYLFTSEFPIHAARFSNNGSIQFSHQLNDVIQGEDRIAKTIVCAFYESNTFLFLTAEELVNFVLNIPWESLGLIRHVCLGSNVVRRSPGARDFGFKNRTPEDADVGQALRRMPRLNWVSVVLGYDIGLADKHYRTVMADEWCGFHPNLPDLEFQRRDEETLPTFAGDRSTIEADDHVFFFGFQVRMNQRREKKSDQMDMS